MCMPTKEKYVCKNCKLIFARTRSDAITPFDLNPKCPFCGSRNVKKLDGGLLKNMKQLFDDK